MKASEKSPRREDVRPAPRGATGAPWKRLFLLGGLTLVSAALVWAAFEFVIWSRLPPELVGKWVVTSPTDQEGATFDFFRGGVMEGRLNARGKMAKVVAQVYVEDHKLYLTTKNPDTGQHLTRAQTIRVLTASELVLVDEQGQAWRMERVDN